MAVNWNMRDWLRRGKARAEETPIASCGTDIDSVSAYTDWLLRSMLKRSVTMLVISESTPLPRADSEESAWGGIQPSRQAVINRLKLLCGLNPVRFPLATDGRFVIERGVHRLQFEVRFDDRPDPPICTLRLRIRPAK